MHAKMQRSCKVESPTNDQMSKDETKKNQLHKMIQNKKKKGEKKPLIRG
jgi:hypothetical protein